MRDDLCGTRSLHEKNDSIGKGKFAGAFILSVATITKMIVSGGVCRGYWKRGKVTELTVSMGLPVSFSSFLRLTAYVPSVSIRDMLYS